MNQEKNSALLIIDVQNDFCNGGSLAVNGSLEIIPIINNIRKQNQFNFTLLSQDYHPPVNSFLIKEHISFKDSPLLLQVNDEELDEISRKWKGAFPSHCIQGTYGAEFHNGLDIKNIDYLAQKGQNKLVESFSAFGNAGLIDFIKSKNINRVYCCGLAYDFCVGSSAVDAAKNGLEVFVIKDASRSISKETSELMEIQFTQYGVKVINSDDINLNGI